MHVYKVVSQIRRHPDTATNWKKYNDLKKKSEYKT